MTGLFAPWPRLLTASLILLVTLSGRADVVTLQPTADTTLVEVAPDNNLGGATFFNAGTAGSNGKRNRALLLFDVASAIPAGSIITEATLLLDVIRQPIGALENSAFSMRRVLQPWGEGMQVPVESPGLGVPAVDGEATWSHRFASGAGWTIPGGQPGVDFSMIVSSTGGSAGAGDQVVFPSTAELVGDLQFWLQQPGMRFGWMLVTESEELAKTARSFASRESEFPPTLVVQFTPVPEPGTMTLALVSLACAASVGYARRRCMI